MRRGHRTDDELFDVEVADEEHETVQGYAATFKVSMSDSGNIPKTIEWLTEFVNEAAVRGIYLVDDA